MNRTRAAGLARARQILEQLAAVDDPNQRESLQIAGSNPWYRPGMNLQARVSPTRTTDEIRLEASSRLDPARKSALGQFLTPSEVARFMASLFRTWPARVQLLDPGAGTGSLSSAFADQFAKSAAPGSELSITAYEIEPILLEYLSGQLGEIQARGAPAVSINLAPCDFLKDGASQLSSAALFTHAILNPPYKKIGASSEYRLLLRQLGIETVNLYAAFLALAVARTRPGGEIVAIVPRSFCNGMYFRPFRKWLLERAAIRHVHLFESRKKTFRDDDVLQENIIIRLERLGARADVVISTSDGPTFSDYRERLVPIEQVVKAQDAESFIHLPTQEASAHSALFRHPLSELGLEVATGPVVDFRVKEHWLDTPTEGSVPLLYAHHFARGALQWPREHKKPNALVLNSDTRKWLMPRGWYAITKRFSAKEESRRLVAFVVDPGTLPHEFFGFENHLNVIHSRKTGIAPDLARGIAVFLNSSFADRHFRVFSGHTQVNATDLRAMLFPDKDTLARFGEWSAGNPDATPDQLDRFVELHGG